LYKIQVHSTPLVRKAQECCILYYCIFINYIYEVYIYLYLLYSIKFDKKLHSFFLFFKINVTFCIFLNKGRSKFDKKLHWFLSRHKSMISQVDLSVNGLILVFGWELKFVWSLFEVCLKLTLKLLKLGYWGWVRIVDLRVLG